MNRLYYIPIGIVLVIAAITSSCKSSSDKQDDMSPAKVVFRTADSLAVEGILLADSTKLVLPLAYAFLNKDTTTNNTERESLDNLHLNKTGYLVATNPLCGYDVTADIYDAEENIFLSIIEYHLKKSGREYVVKTTCDPRYLPIPDEASDAQNGFPIYKINNDSLFVQGDIPEFESILFCFKDVDFDGEKEFCCIQTGYNRHYFNAYKLQHGNALLMYGAPYDNLVVGDYVVANTTFDYANETITIVEQSGISEYNEDVYGVDRGCRNTLNPMKRKYGRHVKYGKWGSNERIYQDALLVEETQEYYLLGGSQSIEAKYEATTLDTLKLKSIVNTHLDNGRSKVLWRWHQAQPR